MKLVSKLALFLSLALISGTAHATIGYFSHGYGSYYKAIGGAGVALPLNTLAASTNPASMVFVGKRWDVGIALFSPDRQYTVDGNPTGFPGTFGLAPGTVESGSNLFPVPSFGANWMLNESNSFGIVMYGNGGMNTDYDFQTFGFKPTGVNMAQLFISPTYAVKLGEGQSVGITGIISYQYFEAKGMTAFAPFSSDPENLSDNGTDSSTGFGARFGYLGQFSPFFSLGASYQTKVEMGEFKKYAGLFAEQGGFDIPQNFVIGVAIMPNEKVDLLFDVQWINYADINSIANPLLPNLAMSQLGNADGAGFGWEDTTAYKFGLQYKADNGLTWRGGYSYGKQPIPSSEMLFNIVAPGVVEHHLTFGLSKRLSESKEIAFSLMRALTNDVNGPNLLEVPGQQDIKLTMNQWEFDVSFSFGIGN
jgi:long-chain fatty acid transport protein